MQLLTINCKKLSKETIEKQTLKCNFVLNQQQDYHE